jgi:hypothetical protein
MMDKECNFFADKNTNLQYRQKAISKIISKAFIFPQCKLKRMLFWEYLF